MKARMRSEIVNRGRMNLLEIEEEDANQVTWMALVTSEQVIVEAVYVWWTV
jgi:hypothetical protein